MISRIKCYFNYHVYYVIGELHTGLKKLGCLRCNKLFGTNNFNFVVPWDKDLEEIYQLIEKFTHQEPLRFPPLQP